MPSVNWILNPPPFFRAWDFKCNVFDRKGLSSSKDGPSTKILQKRDQKRNRRCSYSYTHAQLLRRVNHSTDNKQLLQFFVLLHHH